MRALSESTRAQLESARAQQEYQPRPRGRSPSRQGQSPSLRSPPHCHAEWYSSMPMPMLRPSPLKVSTLRANLHDGGYGSRSPSPVRGCGRGCMSASARLHPPSLSSPSPLPSSSSTALTDVSPPHPRQRSACQPRRRGLSPGTAAASKGPHGCRVTTHGCQSNDPCGDEMTNEGRGGAR